MFFTVLKPLSDYIQQNFSDIFTQLSPINDSDDDDTITHHIVIHIGCQFSTQEELDDLV